MHRHGLRAQGIRRGARLQVRVGKRSTAGRKSCIRCRHGPAPEGHHIGDTAIRLRTRPGLRDLIGQAAALPGKNRSDFRPEVACDRARSVLLDQVCFRLDDRRFKDFVRRSDAPPLANAGLERLMAVKARWAAPGARKVSRRLERRRVIVPRAAPEPLNSGHHIDVFDCGEPVLDEWRRKRAPGNQPSGASRTFVVAGAAGRLMGYDALAGGAVVHETATSAVRRTMPDPVPVPVLGRLAVDRQARGMKLGVSLVQDAVKRARPFDLHHGVQLSTRHPMTLMMRLPHA